MISLDVSDRIQSLRALLGDIVSVVDVPQLQANIASLSEQAGAADLWDNPESAQKVTSALSHAQAQLARVTGVANRLDDLDVLVDMAKEADDQESADEALAELASLEKLLAEMEVQTLLDGEYDANPAIVTIRAGAGGVDAADFADILLRMYLRYAERQGWRTELVSESQSELGGYKEVVVRIDGGASGDGVYGWLKFESGGHRVQRVPATETQGRIHTSACTVAVLPEPDEAEAIKINPSDLRIDTYRASGAGGQHINKTDSAVRITHLPTGIVAECQDGRSQHSNKAQALRVLTARIQEKERSERAAKDAAMRKGLIGSGDRSDRIRTYNYPQGRWTDHRINLTLYKLNQIMEGDMGEGLLALRHAREAELLADLENT